jgi:hypothetical protein
MNYKLRCALVELEAVKQAFPAKVEAMKTKLGAWVAAKPSRAMTTPPSPTRF